MGKLTISKNSVAYSEGRQAFHQGLDVLDDNPHTQKNIFGALPLKWFEWHDGFEEEYQKARKALDD